MACGPRPLPLLPDGAPLALLLLPSAPAAPALSAKKLPRPSVAALSLPAGGLPTSESLPS